MVAHKFLASVSYILCTYRSLLHFFWFLGLGFWQFFFCIFSCFLHCDFDIFCLLFVWLGFIWCWRIDSKQSWYIAEHSFERCSEHSISFPNWCVYCSSHDSWFHPWIRCLNGIPFSLQASGLACELWLVTFVSGVPFGYKYLIFRFIQPNFWNFEYATTNNLQNIYF